MRLKKVINRTFFKTLLDSNHFLVISILPKPATVPRFGEFSSQKTLEKSDSKNCS